MKRPAYLVALVLATLLSAACRLSADPTSAAGEHDIGELMSTAEEHYDLSKMDAVILFEGRAIELAADGGRRTTVHRIVWINTEIGIEDYADLRVPYNSDTASLDVVALRTWMDGRWWPSETEISPTAIVETLPYAVRTAHDYTSMRETMLLHDGVEIPCIVETVYTITEESPRSGAGAEGLWLFPKDDPVVRTSFAISVPADLSLSYRAGNGAPEPEVTQGGALESYAWHMDLLDRLAAPRIADPAALAPYVVWSTWDGWDTLGTAVVTSMEEAAVLSEALAETLAARIKHEPTRAAKAHAVAAFVNEGTRRVRYDDGFWSFSPRRADRTWETAYGHRLDRAVLAAAMFREAGCEVTPTFVGAGYGDIDADVPTLARFDGICLWVAGDDLEALYDPADGTLNKGLSRVFGRTVWSLGAGPGPAVWIRGDDPPSRLELILTVQAPEDEEEQEWSGTGVLRATGGLCVYGDVVGLASESADYLGNVAGSVLAGTDVADHNLAVLDRENVTAGFAFGLSLDEPDELGRTGVIIGDPTGGIVDRLPGDVRIHEARRESPILLAAKMGQTIVLRLKAGSHDVFHLPAPRTTENELGRFGLTVETEGDWVTVTRELDIAAGVVSPDQWPMLRALLLEETDARNQTILLK